MTHFSISLNFHVDCDDFPNDSYILDLQNILNFIAIHIA